MFSLWEVFVLLVIAGIAYVAWTTQNPVTFDDNFVIGYVEKSDPIVIQPPPVPQRFVDLQLQKDCIDTLVKLDLEKERLTKKPKKSSILIIHQQVYKIF